MAGEEYWLVLEEFVVAEVTVTHYIDDLDGTELGPEAEHVTFAFEGSDFMIDLGPENAQAFREGMAPYVEAARKVGSSRARSGRASSRRSASKSSGVDTKAVREWARTQGLEVSDRGRIPAEIMDAYTAAH